MTTLDILRREPDILSYRAGETVFREGDAADRMFAVVEGEVEIHINGKVVERVASGGVFGETALIDGKPRSGTAVVATDCRLAAITEKRFLRLVEQVPQFALQVMRIITERLRRSSAH
jgi:CRP-like cAMP-binding protein